MPVDPNFHRSSFAGRDPDLKPGPWDCPTCHTKNVTPFEEGCPSCGAGTPEQAEMARLRALEGVPSVEELDKFIVDSMFLPTSNREMLLLGGLTDRAKLTVARALAHYAEHAVSHPASELTRAQCLGWARALVAGE